MKIEEMISEKYSSCCGCEACKNICPKNAISMVRDAEGFAYPKINSELCIKCGRCDAVCPSLNFREREFPDELPKTFVAVNPNEKVRRHSSSGGVFSALSEIIFNDGGIVFGAGFDENFHVVHTSAENFDELENLRGSKYVQSQIGEVYRRVKKELESGRKVLFSGTSCQCVGLKSFLGGDSENLLAVDVFCHGVPSPEIWESYIDYRGQGHEIVDVDFRNKSFGWLNFCFQIVFEDCGRYRLPLNNDAYGQEFLLDTFLRPSCAECKFRFPNGQSDISIGDAWGIQNFAQDMNDNLGTSLAVVHSEKGKNFVEKTDLKTREVNFGEWIMSNPYFLIPSVEDSRRKDFFADLEKSKNPVATMFKYFLQDSGKVGNDNQQKIDSKLGETLKKILAHYSKKREQNALLFTVEWDEEFEKSVKERFFSQVENPGILLALPVENENGETFLRYCDSKYLRLQFVIEMTEDSIKQFKQDYGLTNVLFGKNFDADVKKILDWLKN